MTRTMNKTQDVLKALEQAESKTPALQRPEGAIDCALKAYGCDGWVLPQFVIAAEVVPALGLCPKREQHARIALSNPEARAIRTRLFQLLRTRRPELFSAGQANQA